MSCRKSVAAGRGEPSRTDADRVAPRLGGGELPGEVTVGDLVQGHERGVAVGLLYLGPHASCIRLTLFLLAIARTWREARSASRPRCRLNRLGKKHRSVAAADTGPLTNSRGGGDWRRAQGEFNGLELGR